MIFQVENLKTGEIIIDILSIKLTILGTKWCQLNWPIQLDRGQNRNRIWKSSQIGRNQISGRTPTKLIKLNPLNTMLLGLAKTAVFRNQHSWESHCIKPIWDLKISDGIRGPGLRLYSLLQVFVIKCFWESVKAVVLELMELALKNALVFTFFALIFSL